MPNYLKLPDGTYYTVPDGVDPDMGMAMAKDKYPEAFKEPEGGFGAAFKSGVAKLKGDVAATAGRTGLMDTDAAEAYRAEQDAISKRTFKPTEESLLDAPWTHIKELAGQSLPYMAAPVVAGGTATVLGAPALLATGAAGLASAAQFTGSNLDRQVEEGKKLADTDLTSAALAAIPQAALDMVGFKMIPGVRQIMQLAGKEVTEEAAKRIATQSVKQIAADYAKNTGKAMGVEGLTEAAQQVFERMQAGLSLTDAKARKEYFDNFVGGAVLGGAMSGPGRFVERSGERAQQEGKIKQDAQAAQTKAAADEAAAREKKLQDPEYLKDLTARYQQHAPTMQKLKDAAEAPYDKTDMVATAEHNAAVAAFKEYKNSDEVAALRTEISESLPQIRAMQQAEADKKAADAAEAARPRTPDEIAQMQSQLEAAQAGLAQATETAKAAIRSGDTEAHDTALEAARKHRESINDLTARIPPPEPPAPAIPALDKLNKALQGRLKAYDGAIGTDPDAAASIAEQIRTLQAQIKEVSPTYAELAGRQDLLKQQKPSKNPVNPMARFMEDSEGLDAQRDESVGMHRENLTGQEIADMEAKRLDTTRTAQTSLLDTSQDGTRTVRGAELSGRTRADLIADIHRARQAKDRAAVQAAVESLRDLNARDKAVRDAGGRETGDIQKLIATRVSRVGQAPATETTITPPTATPAAVQQQLRTLPERLEPETEALLQRINTNFRAVAADKGRLEQVSEWLHGLRTGAATRPVADPGHADNFRSRDISAMLDRLEQGKRSETQTPTRETAWGTATKPTETAIQKDMFPDEKTQGKTFASRAAFEAYMASDVLQQRRADMGLLSSTVSRLMKRIEPFEKKLANLQKQFDAAQARVNAGDAAAVAAQDRLAQIKQRMERELESLQHAHDQARAMFERATEKSRETSALIHENQTEMENSHVEVEKAAQAVDDAQDALAKALNKDVNKDNYSGLQAAKRKIVEAINNRFAQTDMLDATTVTFLRSDLRLQMELSEQLDALRGMHDTLVTARMELSDAKATQARSTKNRRELKAAHDAVIAAQTELNDAKNDLTQKTPATATLARAIERLRAALPAAAAERAKVTPDEGRISMREAQDGLARAEEQLRMERREAMLGERIDNSKYRAARDAAPVDQTRVERKAQLEAAAANEALPKTTRDKARRQFLAMEREDSAVENRTNAQAEVDRLVSDRIPALEQKTLDAPTAANKQELAKAKRSVAKLNALLQRAKRTPVGRVEGPMRPAETAPIVPGERSELVGRVTQASKKERIAGEQRTASEESIAGKNKTGTRNKVVEQRKIVEPNRVISKDEMQEANADADRITQESANKALETERLQRLQEEADDARLQQQAEEIAAANRDAKKAKGKEAVAAPANTGRQERAPAKAKTSRVFDDIYNESPFDDDFGGEYEASVFRTATTSGPGMKAAEVTRLANRITEGWTNTPETVVVATEAELPARIQEQAKRDGMTGKVPGLFDPTTGKVFLVAENLHDGNDVALTVVHEIAGHYGLRDMFGERYDSAMNRLYKGNAAIKTEADARMAADKNMKLEVAVEESLAAMAERPTAKAGWQAALSRAYHAVKELLFRAAGITHVSDGDVQQIVANARRHVKRGARKGGTGGGVESVYRGADFGKYDGTPITTGTAEPDTRGWVERLTGGLGMALEHGIVDMHGPLMRALDAVGDTKATMQAKYMVREAGASVGWVQSFLSYGAPELFKDSKGLTGIRATKSSSGADVLRAAEAIPGANAAAKYHMATIYMAAERALRVGADKVGIPEAKLAAVRAQVAADPALKSSLTAFRKEYNKYNEKLVNFVRDSGGITSDKAKEFLEHGDYVPLYRVRDGQLELSFGDNDYVKMGDIANTPFLHALKGGDAEIMPINESMIFNTKLLTDIALTNLAKRNVGYVMAAAGKPLNKMQVRFTEAPAGKEYLSWTQEPVDADDTGHRHIKLDTKGTVMGGVPTMVLAQSIEGFHAMMPAYVQWAAKLNDWLRAGVTRMPPYTVRQLLKDPFSSASTSGMAANPLTAVGRAMTEYRKGMWGDKTDLEAANRHALVQSNLFTGDHDDMIKLTKQIADGDHPNAVRKLLNELDRSAHVADAATRVQIYKDGLARGLSEVESAYRTRESMNFHKRGAWGSIQHANRMLPFFNSGIQALNVAAKALQGKMPFEEQLKIKQTYVRNALMLAMGGMVYAAMKADDDEYMKLRPSDRYGNFHIGLPGTELMLKIPIGYAESGGMAWAAGQALIDAMHGTTGGKQVAKALAGYAQTAVPGGGTVPLPSGIKQAVEWATNTDMRTYNPIVSRGLAGRTADEQHNDATPEAFKAFGHLGISPLQLQHAIDGLTGSAASVVLTLLERVVGAGDGADVEKPSLPVAKMPWIKSFIQNPTSDANAEAVYDIASKTQEAKQTFDAMQREGRSTKEIRAFFESHKAEIALAPAAGKFVQQMGEINTEIKKITNASKDRISADRKTDAIERLNKRKQEMSRRYMESIRAAETRLRASAA